MIPVWLWMQPLYLPTWTQFSFSLVETDWVHKVGWIHHMSKQVLWPILHHWNVLPVVTVFLKEISGVVPESSSSSQGFNLKRWTVLAMRQPLSFLWLPVYFKFKILFYTFTKTLGQRFDIFSCPSPKFIVSINHCCPSSRVSASAVLSE